MNLIKQLQKTPKWKEFEEWYNKQDYSIPMEGYLERDYIVGFDDLDFEFTKGVFEKFIESEGFNIEKGLWHFSKEERDNMGEDQILKLRFKEKWLIHSVVIADNYYTSFCLNPVDATNETIIFISFEELLLWYFNN